VTTPRAPDCVGALIRDSNGRVFAQRRSPTRRLFPGIWDIVGGHIEAGESPTEALAREVHEETGWRLRRIEAVVADWEWTVDGVTRREVDYLVEVDGNLRTPQLETGKHDAFAWIGLDDLDRMMEERTDNDRRLRDIVAKAVRTRLTQRLRLEPIGLEHVSEILSIYQDAAVARWWGHAWTSEEATAYVTTAAAAWARDGVHKWIGYDRVTNTVVGRGGLSRAQVDGADRFEVGWVLRGDFWGNGYATEIGRAALAFGFDDLGADEIIAFTEPDNSRSRNVMQRLGMTNPRLIEHDGQPFVCYTTRRY
jgi:RimJ/RimL family protein N-acetyltransferase